MAKKRKPQESKSAPETVEETVADAVEETEAVVEDAVEDVVDEIEDTPEDVEDAIEAVAETTLKLTLLHHGSLNEPRLPIPLFGSDRIAYRRLQGIYPGSLEGDCQFWL